MAKHKKRKSEPTPEAPKPAEPAEGAGIPETEGQAPPQAPKPEAAGPPSTEYRKKLDQLFWLRLACAVGAGFMATVLLEPLEGEDRRWASIIFMSAVFFATIIVAKMMNMRLPSEHRKKLVTQGMGSYIFLYLFVWIVTYTIFNLNNDGAVSLI